MNGRRDDDRRRGGYGDPEEYTAGRRGDSDRDWDEHGYERGPELRGWDGRDERGADRDEERDFDWDRSFRTGAQDRDGRDFERDRDFGRAARELDRAREYGRDFNRDRELDRRGAGRESDQDRTGRRPGDSPSGAFRAFQDESREERERPRRHGDRGRPSSLPVDPDRWGGRPTQRDDNRRGRDEGRIAEEDTRFSGRGPGGHGPGVENMAPPRVGYGTSPSRRDDHEMGHGQFLGGTYRSATPSRVQRPTGRGPKSYLRGDDRIRADICDQLMQGWMNAEDVEVHVKEGLVTLSGTVRSRDEKRAIEDVAEGVLGVKDVSNNIRVNRAEGAQHRPSSEEPVAQPRADTGDDDPTLHS